VCLVAFLREVKLKRESIFVEIQIIVMSFRAKLDPLTLMVSAGERFDVYTVLEKSPAFKTYPKTTTGLAAFWRKEFQTTHVRMDDVKTMSIWYGRSWIPIPTVSFLHLLLAPLYHCDWDSSAQKLIEDVYRGELTPVVSEFVTGLFNGSVSAPASTITIDMVPDDWRDLVEELIQSKNLDLTKYKSVDELEHYVDGVLFNAPAVPEVEVELEEPEKIMLEDKEILARTLGLNPDEFTTKAQAMKLYESRR
jgi:hypothetical protein